MMVMTIFPSRNRPEILPPGACLRSGLFFGFVASAAPGSSPAGIDVDEVLRGIKAQPAAVQILFHFTEVLDRDAG